MIGKVAINRDEPVRELWKRRLAQHTNDTYRGRSLCKMPEDLWTYLHLIEECRPEVILEIGSYGGGSAVWFADQLTAICGGGRVVTIDRTVVQPIDGRVTILTGSLDDPAIVDAAHAICSGKRVMVSEDSAHTYETTTAALRKYEDLVPQGSWFVVEDGVVDEPDLTIWNGGGVQPAIADFLASPAGSRFRQHDLSLYGMTTCHNGWLEAMS